MAAKEASTPAVSSQAVPVTDTHNSQIGAVRRGFLEALIIALLAFAIGLTVGAAICISHGPQTRLQEEQKWPN
jgi:hypothetical protein